MKKKNFKFKIGDKTTDIWAGGLVSTCEYLGELGQGRMLFYDVTFKCFRRVFIEVNDGEPMLNGWDAASRPSKLLV
jgi:hypothetical protein